MVERKIDTSFLIRRAVAETRHDNPHFVVGLDCKRPDQIVAFVSPDTYVDISKQFVKNRYLDGVSIRASLQSLVASACECFEDDREIDRWIEVFKAAAGRLQAFKGERHAALRAASCERCSHSAADHYRAHIGDLHCRVEECACKEFGPLERLAPRTDEMNGPFSGGTYPGLRLVG